MTSKSLSTTDVYTDGSCHTQLRVGGWVALIFTNGMKIVLTGNYTDTTHNRMELTAVIEAMSYIRINKKNTGSICIYSDSQYVVGLSERRQKLESKNFMTKKGGVVQNADLIKQLWELEAGLSIRYEKVKAHQQKTDIPNHNIEADKLSRKIVRDIVNAMG